MRGVKKMKKLLKRISVLFALVGVMVLVSCSHVSQSYADKINKAADNNEHYTLEQVRDDLGDEAVEVIAFNSGFIIAVKGCDSLEDIKAKLDEGKDINGIIVTFVASKATSAEYRKITADDLK